MYAIAQKAARPEQLVKHPIRSFCKSLVRRLRPPSPSRAEEAAAASVPIEPLPPVQDDGDRVIQQGRFEWGSFSAFQDGSIELERDGVRQRFHDFSELKRNLNHAWLDKGS
jgi:hypothetical protein